MTKAVISCSINIMSIAVHVTHEAVQKIGGIGAVISGLLTAPSYREHFSRSLLYGPLFSTDGTFFTRLGKDGVVLYSGVDGHYTDVPFAGRLHEIEELYGIKIVYGTRKISDEADASVIVDVDTVLVYINEMKQEPISVIKYQMWKHFGIESERYRDWDYEQYVRIAIPLMDIFEAIYGDKEDAVHFSHEYMGMPATLKVLVEKEEHSRRTNDITVFYAHEVATARMITEGHQGHDVMFYNVLKYATKHNISMESEFGKFDHNYRNELVKCADKLDYIFAVSDLIKEEYRFLKPEADLHKIIPVFNGTAVKTVTYEEKMRSKGFLKKYGEALFNFTPDIVFTHVTRLVVSKGLWRDMELLEKLDSQFYEKQKKGLYILLSSQIGTGRPSEDIYRMEREYGWPVMHREGWPDLVGMEVDVYNTISLFNAKSRAIKAVFINQFGFGCHQCGQRVPEGAQWIDLRVGSDVELGMSIYEPFGIAQIETLAFGGMAIFSKACGSSALVETVFADYSDAFHCIDFSYIGSSSIQSEHDVDMVKKMSGAQRMQHEHSLLESQKTVIFAKISRMFDQSHYRERIQKSSETAQKLGWEHIVATRILPIFKNKK